VSSNHENRAIQPISNRLRRCLFRYSGRERGRLRRYDQFACAPSLGFNYHSTYTHTPLSQRWGIERDIQKNKTRRQRKTIASSSQHLRLNYCGPARTANPERRTCAHVCNLVGFCICRFSAALSLLKELAGPTRGS